MKEESLLNLFPAMLLLLFGLVLLVGNSEVKQLKQSGVQKVTNKEPKTLQLVKK